MLVLAGLAITGMLFLPSLVSRTSQRNNTAEEAALAGLEDSFRDYVRLYQIIPGTGTWATAIGLVSGLNATQVNCVFPDFPTDTTVQRVFVVDDSLGGASPLLPYTQSTNGLTGTLTNLLHSRARAMIVSSTKRGLALPVSSGFLTQTTFDAIWNWTYNPATEAPPSGWSSAWTGHGEFLHVRHLNLPALFQTVTFENLQYSLNGSSSLTVSSSTSGYFLRGGLLRLNYSDGAAYQARVIMGDETFRLSNSTNLYYLTGNGIPSDTDGIPTAQLTNVAPTATSLPNYDPGRDSVAGLFLRRGGSDASESDPEKVQKWITSAGSITINGTVSLTLYSAMKDFRNDKKGQIQVFLVDCSSSGTSATTISSVMHTRNPWDTASTGTWIQDTISFGSVSYTVASTRRLGVVIVVNNGSGDDMLFAYGTTTYPSRLTLP